MSEVFLRTLDTYLTQREFTQGFNLFNNCQEILKIINQVDVNEVEVDVDDGVSIPSPSERMQSLCDAGTALAHANDEFVNWNNSLRKPDEEVMVPHHMLDRFESVTYLKYSAPPAPQQDDDDSEEYDMMR
jgi:hypothetical protein